MGIGGTIVLMAVGAILTFAVNFHISGINVHLVGIIMMAIGLVGLSAYVSIFKQRRTQPPPPAAPVFEEDRYTNR